MNALFTIGADPEIFVKKNGKAISAHGLVEGTKEKPFKTSNGAYQVDGMALEFNIDPTPVNDFEKFNLNIVKTIADLRSAAGNVNFNISPVQEFDAEYMDAQPSQAKELGCDPDYNAYTLEANPRPPGDRLFRTGAGHIHVGWGADIPVDNEDHMQICANFIKMLDVTVGMFMTFIDRDPRRRELYGKAGAFRPKPYGTEYRTPSNEWIKNRDRRQLVHRLVNKAIENAKYGTPAGKLIGAGSEQQVQDIINNGDYITARTIIDQLLKFDHSRVIWEKIKREFAGPKQEV